MKTLSLVLIIGLFVTVFVGLFNQHNLKKQVEILTENNKFQRLYLQMHVTNQPALTIDSTTLLTDSAGKRITIKDFLSSHKSSIFFRINRSGCEACLDAFLKDVYKKKISDKICLLSPDTAGRTIHTLSSKYNKKFDVLGCLNGSMIGKLDSIPYSCSFIIDSKFNAKNIFFPNYKHPESISDYLEVVGASNNMF